MIMSEILIPREEFVKFSVFILELQILFIV